MRSYQEYRTTQGEGYQPDQLCVWEIEHLSPPGVDYIIRCQYVAIDNVNYLTLTDKTQVFSANQKSRSNLFISCCILENSRILSGSFFYKQLYVYQFCIINFCIQYMEAYMQYLLWKLNLLWKLQINIVAMSQILRSLKCVILFSWIYNK